MSTAIAADVTCILLFAVVGRSSHAQANTVLGVAETAWPFLLGCLLGVLAMRGRRPVALSTGLVVWGCTVVGGMLFRLVTGETAVPVFVVVAAVSLGVLLLGWRAGYTLVQSARSRAEARPAPTTGSVTPPRGG